MTQRRQQRSQTFGELEFSQLQFQLERLEKRLGTERERPGDFESARAMAHRLRNLHALLALTNTNGQPPIAKPS